jgi:hypothetical protein
MKHFNRIFFISSALFLFSCTKLDERFRSDLESIPGGTALNPADLLLNAYNTMYSPYTDQSRFWAAQQHTSDETVGPTRGPDWDDNGVWRVLHAHTWNADHGFLRDTYNELLGIQFAASQVLNANPSARQRAEARFIRALSMFSVLDGWDQVPYREDLTDFKALPKTLKGTEAADFIIAELKAILNDLPETGPTAASSANRNAAKALLMKVYLNKGVFANRTAPTFAAADMQEVIRLGNEIIASNRYSLSSPTVVGYFGNFAPNNDAISTENVYTLYQSNGDRRGGNVRSRWFLGLHYNQNPSGWNGFTTLSDFYDKFSATDVRRGGAYPGVTDRTGLRVGFAVGQQFDQSGTALKDRKGNNLAFTREVKLKETANDLEITGIRVYKYPPDLDGDDPADNDYVIFRYADVMLMVAEAYMRSNQAALAVPLVTAVRTARGLGPLTPLDMNSLIDERGRELYWEGWRRQDLVRFGKFLQPTQLRAQSDPSRLLFPIPNQQLAVNPNLAQNPGY